MKKLVSLIMVLALVLGLATAAFAEEAPAAGSSYDNPLEVSEIPASVKIGGTPASASEPTGMYYEVPEALFGYTVTIESEDPFMVAGQYGYQPAQEVYDDNDPLVVVGYELEYVIELNYWGPPAYAPTTTVFGIANPGEEEITCTMSAEAPALGSSYNPYILTDLSKPASAKVMEEGWNIVYHFEWTAGENGGEFEISNVAGAAENVGTFDGLDMNMGNYFEDNGVFTACVMPYETLTIDIYGTNPDDVFTFDCKFTAHEKGTEYNPIIIADQAKPYSFEVEFETVDLDDGNGGTYKEIVPVFYMLSDVAGATLTIEDAHAWVDGYVWGDAMNDDDDNDDVLSAQFDPVMYEEYAIVVIGSYSANDKKFTVTINEPEGYDENPEVITDISKLEVDIEGFGNDAYFYQWTATDTGKVSMTAVYEWYEDYLDFVEKEWDDQTGDPIAWYDVDANVVISVNGEEVVAANDALVFDVTKGDVVTIAVVNNPLEGNMYAYGITAEVTGALDPIGSATNPIEISDPADLGGIDVPAKGSVNYAINGKLNGQILTIKVDENATVTLNGKEVKAENGVVTAVLDKTPVNTLTVANKGDKAASYVAAINWPAGSESNPIVIESASDLTGIDVAAGESVYYAINSQLNGQILTINVDDKTVVTLNGKEVKAEDGVVTATLEGTPVNALVVTNKGEKDASYTASIAYELGTEGNPIAVTTEKELNGTEIAAGEEVHYLLNSKMAGAVLSVKGDKAYVIVNGEKTEAKDGFIKLTLEAKGATISLVIGNAGEKAATVTLGYSDNPNTGDAGIMAPIAMALVSAMSTVALVIKKKEF